MNGGKVKMYNLRKELLVAKEGIVVAVNLSEVNEYATKLTTIKSINGDLKQSRNQHGDWLMYSDGKLKVDNIVYTTSKIVGEEEIESGFKMPIILVAVIIIVLFQIYTKRKANEPTDEQKINYQKDVMSKISNLGKEGENFDDISD